MKMRNSRGKLITSVVLATMLMASNVPSMAFASETFSDIENHWAKQTIEKWQQYNIINGVGDNRYMPDDNIQRKDFAVIVCKLLGLSEYNDINMKFSDLKEGEYYTEPIKLLASTGIMEANNGKIRPADLVTRQEAASILCKALNIGKSNQEIKGADTDTVDNWAAPYISAMTNEGYMKGDALGNLNPKSNVTRAEALVMISNIIGDYNTDGIIVDQDSDNITSVNEEVKIEDSVIKNRANILLNEKLSIEKSTINKLVVSSSLVNINESNINTLKITKSNITINTDGSVKNIDVNGNNVVINNTGAIQGLVMNPGSSVIYNGNKISNNSNTVASYNSDTIKIVESANIGLTVQLSYDNSLTANVNIGKSDASIVSSGIIYNKTSEAPTLSVYNSKIDTNQLKLQLKNNESITLRGYTIDNKNKVEYTNVIALRGFDFKLGMKMKATEAIRDNGKLQGIKKTVQFSLKGTNIPEIKSIKMVSSTDNILDVNRHESEIELKEDNSRLYNTNKILESVIQFNVNESGTVSLDRFYGYRITFKDNSVYEAFPIIEDSSIPDNYISDISTGEAKFIGEKLDIKGNSYKSAGSIIEETGIAYKIQDYNIEGPDAIGSDWKYIKSNDSIGNNVSIDIEDTTNSVVYYAFYVRTNTGKSYGPIKQIVGRTAPILTGNQSIHINENRSIASIKIGIDTSSGLNLKECIIHSIMEDNKNLDKYKKIRLDTVDSKYSDGVLQIVLSDLNKDKDYILSLLVSNDTGSLDNIMVQFSTK